METPKKHRGPINRGYQNKVIITRFSVFHKGRKVEIL